MEFSREMLTVQRAEALAAAARAASTEEREAHREMAKILGECLDALESQDLAGDPHEQ